jgi:sortase A
MLAPQRKRNTGKLSSDDPALPATKKRGKALRYLGNGLIVVGALLLLGVGGFQAYYWWLESSTPDVQVLSGVAKTTYITTTATPAPASVIVSNAPVSSVPDGASAGGSSGVKVSNATLPDLASASPPSPGAGTTLPTSPPRRLVIPSIKLDSSIVDTTWRAEKDKKTGKDIAVWNVPDYAVGHHQGSANPGMIGNIVLSGHVDYKGEVFRYLNEAKLGDEVRLYNEQGAEYLYIITEIDKVKEEGVPLEQRIQNAAYMNPTPDQTLTMITCWPYGIDNYRWITIAKPYNSLGAIAAGEPQVK